MPSESALVFVLFAAKVADAGENLARFHRVQVHWHSVDGIGSCCITSPSLRILRKEAVTKPEITVENINIYHVEVRDLVVGHVVRASMFPEQVSFDLQIGRKSVEQIICK